MLVVLPSFEGFFVGRGGGGWVGKWETLAEPGIFPEQIF